MTNEHKPTSDTDQATHERGKDDRRGTVDPAENPAPVSPAPDDEAVRRGEEKLDSLSPH